MNFRKLRIFILSSFILFAYTATAQNSAEILQQILKLKETGSVLYLAAHPDDENTNLIAYLSNERRYRTGYLALTRGDGGQNLIGSELGVNLGLIRTEELMAARRIDGGEQFFSRAFDFGFSKNPKETFTIWNKDSLLKDVVKCIRQYKPDIIICRFPEDSRAGHGHHSASAILASEAFDIAGNPSVYPDQVAEFGTWQPKRLFWNIFNFGENNTELTPDLLQIDVGGYNALLGKSYGEIAALSRSQHKCQGFGSAAERGLKKEYFKLVKGDSAQKDIMDGVEPIWSQYKNSIEIDNLFKTIISNFKAENPSNSTSDLIKLRTEISSLPNSNFKTRKLKDLDQIILSSIGFFASYTCSTPITSQGDSIDSKLQILVRSNIPTTIEGISKNLADSLNGTSPSGNTLKTISFKSVISNSSSQPYWLNKEHSRGMFNIENLSQIGKPRNDVANSISFQLKINSSLSIPVTIPLLYNHTDPVKGELNDPIAVGPKVTIKFNNNQLYFTTENKKKISITYQFHGNCKSSYIISNSVSGKGWNIKCNETSIEFSKNGEEKTIEYEIEKLANAQTEALSFFIANEQSEKEELRSLKEIHYDHIPFIVWFPQASITLKSIDLKFKPGKIAYIKGAGDAIAESLRSIGFNVEEFTASQLEGKDLSIYSAIITGIRAYNVDSRLTILQPQLLNYVSNGGRLIIQYNTPSNTLPQNIGPYPLTVGKGRVTEEDAIVTINDSTLSILNSPNKITNTDFNNWVQERGIYFAETSNSNYFQPFSMSDKGEKSLQGSLLYCKYGKGTYIYTGLSFFREIPAGVDGATRLFVNLISE